MMVLCMACSGVFTGWCSGGHHRGHEGRAGGAEPGHPRRRHGALRPFRRGYERRAKAWVARGDERGGCQRSAESRWTPGGKYRRFTGSGGGNDIASCARRTVVTIRHEARKLNEAVSFITSPGYLHGGDERGKAGLMGAPSRVITDKAIFDFDPESKRMRLMSIHPNTTLEDVLSNMNFKPIVPDHLPITEPPTAEQVRLIREEIDPERTYAGS